MGLSIVSGGCSSDNDKQPSGGFAAAPTADKAASAEQIDPEKLKTDKWNAYVDFSNTFNRQVPDAVEAYPQAFGQEAEFQKPAKENGRINFTNKTLNDQNLKKSLDAVLAIGVKEPVDDLDKAAVAMASALKPAWTDLRTMADYFRNKEYIDDGYARAREREYEGLIRSYNSLIR